MFPNLGMPEMIMVMVVAVLLFGKRLPEVGRSLGKGIIEFKKGLRGIEDELDLTATSSPATRTRRSEELARPASSNDYTESSVPKFEPPTTAPVPQMDDYSQPTQD
jgi:sec-independent protein translocase protein TatA